jgi:hypothetical protein
MAAWFGFFVGEDFKPAQYMWSCFLHLPPAMATLLESAKVVSHGQEQGQIVTANRKAMISSDLPTVEL